MFAQVSKRLLAMIALRLRQVSEAVESLIPDREDASHQAVQETNSGIPDSPAGGPPAHWVRLVSEYAPELLRPAEESLGKPLSQTVSSDKCVPPQSRPAEVNCPAVSVNESQLRRKEEPVDGKILRPQIRTDVEERQPVPEMVTKPVREFGIASRTTSRKISTEGSIDSMPHSESKQQLERETRSDDRINQAAMACVQASSPPNYVSKDTPAPATKAERMPEESKQFAGIEDESDVPQPVTAEYPQASADGYLLADQANRDLSDQQNRDHQQVFHSQPPESSPYSMPEDEEDADVRLRRHEELKQSADTNINLSGSHVRAPSEPATEYKHTRNITDQWPHLPDEAFGTHMADLRVGHWPELPEELFSDDTIADEVLSVVNHRCKLNREQRGGAWNGLPF